MKLLQTLAAALSVLVIGAHAAPVITLPTSTLNCPFGGCFGSSGVVDEVIPIPESS
ncbi:hypothetical protein BX600DRAFT_547519 [Xylariales sp. PMI_506]|nr:hypothetical protein BX600DRAFT_547519 [Xylariales sp. PMI_506]